MRKLITALSLAAVLSSGLAMPAYADNWRRDNHRGDYHHDRGGHGRGVGVGLAVGAVLGSVAALTLVHPHPVYHRPVYYNPGYYGYSTTYVAPVRYYEPTYVAPPTYVSYEAPSPSAPYCREFTQPVRVGDVIQESYGTACLQPDGSWQIQR